MTKREIEEALGAMFEPGRPHEACATDAETRVIEADSELYQRVLSRLGEPGEWVEAEESLAGLEQAD